MERRAMAPFCCVYASAESRINHEIPIRGEDQTDTTQINQEREQQAR
jgi:hypothetical protein